MEQNNLSTDDLDEDRTVTYNKVTCPEYFQYKLTGIVVHMGTTDSGHYYSLIKERENGDAWFEFNDHLVSAFNPDNIPNEAFGGEDPEFESRLNHHRHDQAMQQIIQDQGRTKTKNAYILIYERSEFIDQQRFNEFTDDRSIALKNQGQSFYLS